MSEGPTQARSVSSTTATGGAGTLFEQQVDATFLTLLLVNGIPPIISDCTVREVHLQTEREGWNTDDILIVGVNGAGTRRRLIGQAKLRFTVSSSDDECVSTIGDFWHDFSTNPDFSADNDRFVLIVLLGTNTLLGNLGALLACARAANSRADFELRLHTPGFVNATVRRYFDEIYTIVDAKAERSVPVDELWRFLKVIHVLSLDLQTATRQTETQHKTLLAHTANGADPVGSADATWSELVREAGEGMMHGKSYLRSDLPQTALDRHSPVTLVAIVRVQVKPTRARCIRRDNVEGAIHEEITSSPKATA